MLISPMQFPAGPSQSKISRHLALYLKTPAALHHCFWLCSEDVNPNGRKSWAQPPMFYTLPRQLCRVQLGDSCSARSALWWLIARCYCQFLYHCSCQSFLITSVASALRNRVKIQTEQGDNNFTGNHRNMKTGTNCSYQPLPSWSITFTHVFLW